MTYEMTPNDIAEANQEIGNQPIQQQPSAISQFGRGAIAGFANPYIHGLNLLPGVNISDVQRPSGFASGAGNIAGNVGGFLLGGEIADAARGAAEAAPYIGKAAQYLGETPMLNRALGSAAYGGMANQNDRLGGALTGAALSTGFDLVPGAISTAGKVGSYIANKIKLGSPQDKIDDLVQGLGQGQGLEENAKSLASDVKNAYTNATSKVSDMYSAITDKVGDKELMPENYLGMPQEYQNYLTPKLRQMNDKFLNSPTFENAKDMASLLATQERMLGKASDAASINARQGIGDMKDAVNNDIDSFLKNQSPPLDDAYNKAKENFIQNVLPYRNDSYIFGIASGKVKNPQNVSSYFASPEPATQKVVGDLAPESVNKILYDKLGTPGATSSPNAFLRTVDNLDKQGFTSYLSDDVKNQIGQIRSSLANRERMQKVAGLAAGAMIGSHLGGEGELFGGLLGKDIFPFLFNRISSGKTAPLIGSGLSGLSNPFRAAYITGHTQGNQQ